MPRLVSIPAALAMLLLSGSASRSSECLDYAGFLHWAGHSPGDGAFGVALWTTTAYVAQEENLEVVDIADPLNPHPISRIAAPSSIRGIACLGPYVFLACRDFLVVDASQRETPRVVASLDLPDPGYHLSLAGAARAYVPCGDSGVVLIDIADRLHPRIIGRVDTPGHSFDVALRGNVGYIADWDWGVNIVDFTDPDVPAYLGFLPGSYVDECEVVDRQLFVGRNNRLEIYNLTDPANPDLQTQFAPEGGAFTWGPIFKVIVQNGIAYVADAFSGVTAVDVATAGPPRVRGWVPLHPTTYDMAFQEGFLYVATLPAGLQVVQVNAATNPQPWGNIPGDCRRLAALGRRLYIVRGPDLGVYDLTEPTAPVALGTLELGVVAQDIEVTSGTALIATRSKLILVDITDPQMPRPLGSWGDLYDLADIAVHGDVVALAADDNAVWRGMILLDLADPRSPVELGRFRRRQAVQAIALDGSLAYLQTGDSLHIVDVTDPRAPRFVGATGVDGNGVAVEGGFAFVSSRLDGLMVVDARNPQAPQVVAHREIGSIESRGVAVHDRVVYLRGSSGVEIFAVDNPFVPQRKGIAVVPDESGATSDMAVEGGLLLLGRTLGGHAVDIFPEQCSIPTAVTLADLEAFRTLEGVHVRGRLQAGAASVAVLRSPVEEPGRLRTVLEQGPMPAGVFEILDASAQETVGYMYVVEADVRDRRVRSDALFVPSGTGVLRLELTSSNPASGPVHLRFVLGRRSPARLDVYDVAGRVVRSLYRGSADPGSHSVTWDGDDAAGIPVARGVYLLRLEAAAQIRTMRVVHVK